MPRIASAESDVQESKAADMDTCVGQEPDQDSSAAYVDYSSRTKDFWNQCLANGGRKDWYGKAEEWWADKKRAPSTVDGVLGGFGELDEMDVKESSEFLEQIWRLLEALTGGVPASRARALDGGAGIGRVTKHLLSRCFESVDLLEGNRRLLDAAPQFLGAEAAGHLGEMFCTTLQDFEPSPGRYDCIWVQWVIIYLTDVDFVSFLQRCARGLRGPDSFIVIKDNVLSDGEGEDFVVDEDDSSLTRSTGYMEHIFQQAGLEILLVQKQAGFPEKMYPVMMWALQPAQAEPA